MFVINKIQWSALLLVLLISNLDAQPATVARETVKLDSTTLYTPKGWRPPTAERREFQSANSKLVVFSRSFSRGDVCYFEILPKAQTGNTATDDVSHTIYYSAGGPNRQIVLHRFKDGNIEGLQGLFLISPEQKTDAKLSWVQKSKSGTVKEDYVLKVHLKQFPESKSVLPFEKKFVDPDKSKLAELTKRIQAEREMKNKAFSSRSEWSFTNELSHPRDMHYITSAFFSSRLNQRYKDENGKRVYLPPVRSVHRGVDFRGVTGTPVFAVAPGTVVLAHHMHFEGNFTLVDHGNGVFIGYMHQSKILVKVGDTVKAGQIIGEVGATGMVTGSHLHLSIWVLGIPGDALSLLSLPLR